MRDQRFTVTKPKARLRAGLRLVAVGVLLLPWLLLGNPLALAQSGEPWFEPVPETDEFGDGIYTASAQDARGLIWFGSIGGLLRFDGYRTTRFRHEGDRAEGLPGNYIRALLALPDGRLLIGTQGMGLVIHEPDRERFLPGPATTDSGNLSANDAVLAMAHAADGGYWIGTATAGLRYWDGVDADAIAVPLPTPRGDGGSSVTVRNLLVDRAGSVWAGTIDGLYRRPPGSLQFERVLSEADTPDSLDEQYVYSLMQDSTGRIWIGTQAHGLAWTDEAASGLHRLPSLAGKDQIAHEWISGLIEPRPGTLWALVYGGGIAVIDLASLDYVAHVRHDPALAGGLPMDRVLAPLQDRSGLVWVGTWGGGVVRHNPTAGAFRSLRFSALHPEGPSQRSLLSVLELPDGRLWVGTAGNGVDEFGPDLRRIRGYLPEPDAAGQLQDGNVRALASSRDGGLWVGTHQGGLHRYRPDRDDFELRNNGLPELRIRRLLALTDGGLAVGTQRGAAIIAAGAESARSLTMDDGRPMLEPVWSIAHGPDASLWFSTPTRILYMRQGQEQLTALEQPASTGPTPAAIGDLAMDSTKTLWATGSSGLFRLRGWAEGKPVMESWLPASGPPPIGGNLAIDRFDRLWTPRQRIDPAAGEVIGFGRADGADVGNFELGAVGHLGDGRLVFAGTLGLLVLDPEAFTPWRFAPPLAVTGLSVAGAAARLDRLNPVLRLAADERRFSLEFSALDYSEPAHNRYAYLLEGQDPDWIAASAGNRMATYSNLWPGNYTLRVRGGGRDGEWSAQELAIPIVVEPRWWQTGFFVFAALFGIGLLVIGGVQLRLRQIHIHAQELQRLVWERTAALSQAKQATEDTLDNLRNTQQQLVEAEKLASLGQLVAGVAHEINTPVGVAVTAASHLRDLSAQIDSELEQGKLTASRFESWRDTVRTAAQLLLTSLERADSLVGSFRQLAVRQNSEERREFELKELLDLTLASLKAAARDTGHELQVECPAGIHFDSYPGVVLQCIAKCIQNAIDHAFEAGKSGSIQVVARRETDLAYIGIADDGRGMSPEVRAKAFDPFFTTQRGKGATGLGLHLVYHQTRHLLGGRVELDSAVGDGTRVHLILPLRAP